MDADGPAGTAGEAFAGRDVGFVPAECPGANATGATHTSTLLIERLSRHHDLTVYVSTQMDADDRDLPATDRVEYVLSDDLPKLPHPIRAKLSALREHEPALEDHDLVHSYSPAFVPVLADLSVPTLATLNSYVPACPKGDMLYAGTEKCSGPGRAKCVGCVARTAVSRSQGLEDELRAGYTSLARVGFVGECLERAEDVSAYQALSPHLVEDYAGLGFPRDRIHVVPHFCEEAFLDLPAGADHVRPEWPGEGPGVDTPPTGADGFGSLSLLYVGGLQHIKGVDVLLRAVPRLVRRGLDVEVRIAGTGPYEDRLRSLADRLGIGGRLTWLGYVDHDRLTVEYEEADAFVYPGRIDEPFGRVLLEALGTGTPVVTADVGSTDWIVGDAGVSFASGDPDALADACVDLVARYPTVAGAIPERIDRFRPDRVVGEYLDLYDAVARGEPAATREPGAVAD